MIGVIARSGGIHDMVEKISKWARTPRSGMVSTWAMGIIIFFDDYANTLLVGNSMKPISDRLKISREKLAYLVDSTAAPVCSIVLISTWIGTELGYISNALGDYGQSKQAFQYFWHSIPYHFYSIFTIIFVFLISYTCRDFGPMLRAEKRAREKGQVLAPGANPLTSEEMEQIEVPEGKPCRWFNAIIPILVVIFATIFGLYYSGRTALVDSELMGKGWGEQLRLIIKEANSYEALIWAAFWGSLVAGLMAFSQKILSITEIIGAWVKGVKSMMLAMIVLVLAWTLKDICSEMGTNRYIFYNVKDVLSVQMLPGLAFILAGVVAFATGTFLGNNGADVSSSAPSGNRTFYPAIGFGSRHYQLYCPWNHGQYPGWSLFRRPLLSHLRHNGYVLNGVRL